MIQRVQELAGAPGAWLCFASAQHHPASQQEHEAAEARISGAGDMCRRTKADRAVRGKSKIGINIMTRFYPNNRYSNGPNQRSAGSRCVSFGRGRKGAVATQTRMRAEGNRYYSLQGTASELGALNVSQTHKQ